MWFIIVVLACFIAYLVIKPYVLRYDTVVAFTGGLGTGKSYISTLTAVQQLKKNRAKTRLYNLFHPRAKLPLPLLYSSIPLKISRNEYATILEPESLLLQKGFVKGSVVFLDEVDVFANQFAMGNENIIDTSSKKDIQKKREGVVDYDSGLFDEEIRLFRHLYSSPACESKLIVNTQATSNISTIIRRRMNSVFVLSKFRLWKFFNIPLLYSVRVREITITDEITNNDQSDKTDGTRLLIGLAPSHRLYDTHCYRHRADTIPDQSTKKWTRLTTERLTKCPTSRFKNRSKNEGDIDKG